MKKIKGLALAFVALSITAGVMITGTGCNGSGKGADSTSGEDNTMMGAGSSFDNPLFSKMFSEYNKTTGLKINYQSIGSGGGIKGLTGQ